MYRRVVIRICAGKAPATIAAAGIVMLASGPAAAYVGPGAGLSAIGTFLALVAAVFLAVVGFVWYPLKRVLRKSGSKQAKERDRAGRAGA